MYNTDIYTQKVLTFLGVQTVLCETIDDNVDTKKLPKYNSCLVQYGQLDTQTLWKGRKGIFNHVIITCVIVWHLSDI